MTGAEAAAWAGASATLLAVLTALFKEELVRLWRRPKLTARLTLAPPDCHRTIMRVFNRLSGEPGGEFGCFYLRFWVENTGSSEARQVQAFASELRKQHADGIFRKDPKFLPMNLRWSITSTPDNGPLLRAPGISPGMGRHCDLGHITDPEGRAKLPTTPNDPYIGKPVIELDLEAMPHTNSHMIPAGTHQLDVMLAADNTKPVKVTFEISYTGAWVDEEVKMFEDELGIRCIT